MSESKPPFWKRPWLLYRPSMGSSGITKFIVIPSLIQFPNGAFLYYATQNWESVWWSYGIQFILLLFFVWYDERKSRKEDELEMKNTLLEEERVYDLRRQNARLEMKNTELMAQLSFMRFLLEKSGHPLAEVFSEETPPKEPVS